MLSAFLNIVMQFHTTLHCGVLGRGPPVWPTCSYKSEWIDRRKDWTIFDLQIIMFTSSIWCPWLRVPGMMTIPTHVPWAELFRFQSVISSFCAVFQVLLSEGNFSEFFWHLLAVHQIWWGISSLRSKSWRCCCSKITLHQRCRALKQSHKQGGKPFRSRGTEGFLRFLIQVHAYGAS